MIAEWSREAQAVRAAAEERLVQLSSAPAGSGRRMSRSDIRALVEGLGGLLAALRDAEPPEKSEVYRQLGLRMTYDHENRMILVESRPEPPEGIVLVSEGEVGPIPHGLHRSQQNLS